MKQKMFLDEASLLSIREFENAQEAHLPLSELNAWLLPAAPSEDGSIPIFKHSTQGALDLDLLLPQESASIFPALTFNHSASGYGYQIGDKVQFPFADCHYEFIVISEHTAVCDQSIAFSCFSETGDTSYENSEVKKRIDQWFHQYSKVLTREREYKETDTSKMLLTELAVLNDQIADSAISSCIEEIRSTMEFVLGNFMSDRQTTIRSTKRLFEVILPELVSLVKDYLKLQVIQEQSDLIHIQLREIEKSFLYLKEECEDIKKRAIEWKGMEIDSSIAIIKEAFKKLL